MTKFKNPSMINANENISKIFNPKEEEEIPKEVIEELEEEGVFN